MTLLATEIHRQADMDVIVFVADQRIMRGSRPVKNQQKIFPIEQIRAGIGYFGLATVPVGHLPQPMADYLQDFLYTVKAGESLASVANRLCEKLNHEVPAEVRNREPSGIHLAGFADDGMVEFWIIRNMDDDDGRKALEMTEYYSSREDFRRRDAHNLPIDSAQIYRNGDIRPHVLAWTKFDKALAPLLHSSDFKPLLMPNDYVAWVKSKMMLIAQFYDAFAEPPAAIGEPIDAFAFTPTAFVGADNT
jgi:hypothetical protein